MLTTFQLISNLHTTCSINVCFSFTVIVAFHIFFNDEECKLLFRIVVNERLPTLFQHMINLEVTFFIA